MNQPQKQPTEYTLKSTFRDLRKIFGIQIQEFTTQFVKSGVDLEKFFVDADNNDEWLQQIIEEWCEKEEPETCP